MLYPNPASSTAYMQQYFRRKKIPYTDAALIQVLDDTRSKKMSVYWAVLALRDVGTELCIPALKAKLHYPKRDVKDCSILTIAHIAGASETVFYTNALLDKRTQKGYPMWAICDAGDERAIEASLEYMAKSIKKLKKAVDPGDGYDFCISYLLKFLSYDARIKPLLREVTKYRTVPGL